MSQDFPQRRSIRLKEYDYSHDGSYFVTICTQDRKCLFGEVTDGKVELNEVGRMVEKWLGCLINKFPNILINEYILMPNHFHIIITIKHDGRTHRSAPTNSSFPTTVGADLRVCPNINTHEHPKLSQIIQWLKTMTTTDYIRRITEEDWERFNGKIWQRNYYEHIVRDEGDLIRIQEYIQNNPINWEQDELFI